MRAFRAASGVVLAHPSLIVQSSFIWLRSAAPRKDVPVPGVQGLSPGPPVDCCVSLESPACIISSSRRCKRSLERYVMF